MTEEDQESLARMRGAFPQLDRYGLRLRDHLYPEPGSALAFDDDAVPRPLRLSQHVWGALSSGHDHLSCIQLTVESNRTFTSATGTLARGALLASAHAVWLLLDDDVDVRRQKARRYSQEWLYRRIEWQKSITEGLSAEDQIVSAEQIAMFEEDLHELTEGHTPLPPMRPTDVIKEAATYAFADPELIQSAMSDWNRLSGDAHALGWPAMLQSTTWGSEGDDGARELRVAGSMERLTNAFLAAYFLHERGWARLWELATLQGTPD